MDTASLLSVIGGDVYGTIGSRLMWGLVVSMCMVFPYVLMFILY